MPGPDIFLSYNREDAIVAKLFADSFARQGLDVWWDQTLRSRETYDAGKRPSGIGTASDARRSFPVERSQAVAEDKTTVVKPGSRSGSAGWIVALVLVVALAIGVVFFSRLSTSQTTSNNAVSAPAHRTSNAASQVGRTAEQAGNDAQDAAQEGNQ